ncbi:restriction endonuclease type i hsds [Trichococcus flocculiformis]|uniref:Restriction endonuclease type i hsds n=1 Tax=Trichococcus flocculiformis TaxID=82803 RepID=A0AB38BGL7_9LACT|nr:restriction endonuclease subunit S [Trichococcus flocculiformis]SBO15692.1 restriction endonuclease type i hsds [Trichococcus flocculiformis]SFH67196.1 type I restriction enzyme, S subunit [Trichococcus flocculiformis]
MRNYDWEQRKLGDDKDVRDGTHDSPKYHQEGHPLVTSKNLNDYGLDMTDVSLISDADFEAINKRSKVDNGDILFGMIGTIGNPVIVDRSDFAIKNVALIKEGGDIPNRFLIQLLKSSVFEKYIRNENAGNTQKFLGLSKIREFTFFTPTTEEQIRIATFFKQLDDTIALHQRKLTLLEQLKQTYLQVMFPQGKESIPKLRFTDHSEPWEQRKLGEVGSVVMCKRIFKDQTTAFGDIPFYKIGTFGGSPDSFIPNDLFEEYKKNYPYPEIGDILMSASGTIGRTVVYEGEKAYYQDSNIVWLKTDKSLIDNSFLKQFYQVVKWSGLEGSTIKRLYNSNILSTGINLPSLREQTKLGTFFNQIDNTIALHQKKIAHLKALKSTLLNKMFI